LSWSRAAHNTFCVSLQFVCSYCTIEALIFLAFHLSLKMHVHLQYLSMYYHRDPSDDPYHRVDAIPEKRLTDQEKNILVNWLISSIWNNFSWNRFGFCKDTLMLTRKWSDSMEDTNTPLIKLSLSTISSWPLLVARESTIPEHSLKKSAAFRPFS